MANILLDNQAFANAFNFLGITWWIWLPLILLMIFWETWMGYVHAYFNYGNFKNKYLLLEIKVPRDVAKSPKAMESILAGIHGTNRRGNAYERYWDGWLTATFSLEIVGNSSGVHFYVWGPTFFKKMIENQIYAQYPTCEIKQVDDYTSALPPKMPAEGWDIFGSEFLLSKPDAYPIRTYEDFDVEDYAVKEEDRKISPLSPIIEYLGSLKGTENYWLQIIVKPSSDQWQQEGAALIAKMSGKKPKTKPGLLGGLVDLIDGLFRTILGVATIEDAKKEERNVPISFLLTPGELEVVKAIENNMSKIGFDVGIRWIYLAKKNDYNVMAVPATLGLFKLFSSPSLNGFKLNVKVTTSIDYVFKKTRLAQRRNRIYNAYRLRSYFHPPYRGKPFVLSSSELATIYHFPGMVAGSPGMERIESKRGAPPTNLPT